MRSFFRLAILGLGILGGQIAFTASAQAACPSGTFSHTCYGVTAGSMLTTAVFSGTSGGSTCSCFPVAGDNVILDGNSGAGTYQPGTGLTLNSFDMSAFSGTFQQGGQSITISGNDSTSPLGTTLVLPSSGTFTVSTGVISMTSTSGTSSIKSNGKSMNGLTVNGAGGTFQFLDAANLTANNNILTVTAGTLNFNGQNVSALALSSNNTNTRAINMGSSTLTITTTSPFDISNATGMTLTAASSTITFTDTTTTSTQTLHLASTAGGPLTLGTVNIPACPTCFYLVSTASGQTATIATLNVPSATSLEFGAGGTYVITNGLTMTGSSTAPQFYVVSNPVKINGGLTATISSANNVTLSYVAISNIAFTGGGTMTATNSLDLGNNSGITITAPSGAGGGPHIIGGWLLKRDVTGPASNDDGLAFAAAAG